jgi:hypothetical protein
MTDHRSLAVAACLAIAVPALRATAQPRDAPSGLRVTVIGCVESSEPGSRADGRAASAAPRFVLSNVTLAGDDRATDTAGSQSKAALLAASIKKYRLEDAGQESIARHVGERVEVSGPVVLAPDRPTGTAGSPEGDGDAALPTLKAETIRVVSRESAVCRP